MSNKDKQAFDEAFANKVITLISLSAFMALAIWMILDPSGSEHNTVEKGSVYILKEIWSFEAGIVFLAIVLPFILLTTKKLIGMRKSAWYRDESGYYLYVNKERSAGNHSLTQGKNLMVFHPESGTVLKLKNYYKAKHHKFFTAYTVKSLSCNKAYWQADKDGFYLFYEGKRLENMTSKYDGDDLFVKAPDVRKSFKLTNYRNSLDNVIREAEVLN